MSYELSRFELSRRLASEVLRENDDENKRINRAESSYLYTKTITSMRL